jgi:hypothetical protein
MKIELKALKYSDFASQETHCFQANIYIDGKMRGWADNDGRGGMTNIQPHELWSEIKQHTDKIPPTIYKYGDQEMTLEESPDSYIDGLVTLALHEKDLKRAMKTRILFVQENQVFETGKLTAAQLAASLANAEALKARLKTEKVLNLLPIAEALELYAAGMKS